MPFDTNNQTYTYGNACTSRQCGACSSLPPKNIMSMQSMPSMYMVP